MNYIYAILYSNKYRETYKELLKIDYPKIPLPKNASYFFEIAKLGERLINNHLLKDIDIMDFITSYPQVGNHEITNVIYDDNKVFINKDEYFDNISEEIYNFMIGSYNPASKWLKDRKGRILSNNDLLHYQKIIVSLNNTIQIMKEIDKIIIF